MNPAELVRHRSSLLIFRDCLKLANRMVNDDPVKATAVRRLLRSEFVKNREVEDEEQIHSLKMKYMLLDAVR